MKASSPPPGFVKIPPIKKYKGDYYYIDCSGTIWSSYSGRVIQPIQDAGYIRYNLHTDGSVVSIAAHICVIAAFGTQSDRKKLNSNNYVVNHLNGIKEDNSFSNLEVVTQRENIVHALGHGLTATKRRSYASIDSKTLDRLIADAVELYEGYFILKNGTVISTHVKPHFQKITTDAFGYDCTSLFISGVGKRFRIHQLVAMAYLEQPDQYHIYVNHIDGDKKNNHLSNLEWSTPSQNAQHQCSSGFHRVERAVSQYTMTGVYMTSYPSVAEAARQSGVPYSSIYYAAHHGVATHDSLWAMGTSQAPLPNPLSRQRRRPVNAFFSDTGQFYRRYASETDAARDLGICQYHIWQIASKSTDARGKRRRTAGGYTFAFADTANVQEIPKSKK